METKHTRFDGEAASATTKARAWAQIADGGEHWESNVALAGRVPRRLDAAWDTSKRSREYLNAAEGVLEPRYYVHGHTLAAGREAPKAA